MKENSGLLFFFTFCETRRWKTGKTVRPRARWIFREKRKRRETVLKERRAREKESTSFPQRSSRYGDTIKRTFDTQRPHFHKYAKTVTAAADIATFTVFHRRYIPREQSRHKLSHACVRPFPDFTTMYVFVSN